MRVPPMTGRMSCANALKTIGYSNLLMLDNVILTFEYLRTKDGLNNVSDIYAYTYES